MSEQAGKASRAAAAGRWSRIERRLTHSSAVIFLKRRLSVEPLMSALIWPNIMSLPFCAGVRSGKTLVAIDARYDSMAAVWNSFRSPCVSTGMVPGNPNSLPIA